VNAKESIGGRPLTLLDRTSRRCRRLRPRSRLLRAGQAVVSLPRAEAPESRPFRSCAWAALRLPLGRESSRPRTPAPELAKDRGNVQNDLPVGHFPREPEWYGSAVRTPSSIAGFLSALIVLAAGIPPAVGAEQKEFHRPSWTALPAPSPYNTTPPCPLDHMNDFDCEVPSSALPPRDVNNTASYLNSGYWPSEKRPDIEVYAANWFFSEHSEPCDQHLVHYCYLIYAQDAGYPVTHVPQVGDLWFAPGACIGWGGPAGPPSTSDCASDPSWYMGYVEQVFADGSFIQSSGGSTTPADSGLAVTWFSGSMDAYTDFVPLMPEGTPLPVPVNEIPPVLGGAGGLGSELYVRNPGIWRNSPLHPSVPLTRRYYWVRCNSSGANCAMIPGTASEDTASLIVVAADAGHTLRLAESAENVAGVSDVVLSAPTAVVAGRAVQPSGGLAGRVTRSGLVLYVRGKLIGRRAYLAFSLQGPGNHTLKMRQMRITLARRMYLHPVGGIRRGYVVHAARILVPSFRAAGRGFAGIARTFVAP
jgi:hypothetical protein